MQSVEAQRMQGAVECYLALVWYITIWIPAAVLQYTAVLHLTASLAAKPSPPTPAVSSSSLQTAVPGLTPAQQEARHRRGLKYWWALQFLLFHVSTAMPWSLCPSVLVATIVSGILPLTVPYAAYAEAPRHSIMFYAFYLYFTRLATKIILPGFRHDMTGIDDFTLSLGLTAFCKVAEPVWRWLRVASRESRFTTTEFDQVALQPCLKSVDDMLQASVNFFVGLETELMPRMPSWPVSGRHRSQYAPRGKMLQKQSN